MRASRTFQLQSIILLYLTTFAAAWPLHWPRWLPELDALVVRQDSGNSTGSASATGSSAPKETGSSSGGGGGTTFSMTGTNTAKATGTAAKGNSTRTYATSYDARLPAGGVSMMTPAVSLGQQYFKIGEFVTFGWNYTSLEATPTAVNVMATCTANKQLYTIATNVPLSSNSSNNVVWDTGDYQATAVQNPLLTQTYTLIIYDAGSSISATAQAGYLAVYNQYTFGMYTPQAYTPLNEFKCATCSSALGDMERRAIGLVLGMGLLTVLSFTWFVGGTGVVW